MPGASLEISVVPFARYAVRATATHDGATSQSGRVFFDAYADKIVTLPLPPPVSSEAPIDDEAPPPSAGKTPSPSTLAPNGVFSARIVEGVIEHVLVPASGDGVAIHVATSSRTTALPDVTRVGLTRPTGRYAWTMEHFPKLAHIDLLSGEDGRVTPASWKSAPRIIVID
jgi:hypothetical protein